MKVKSKLNIPNRTILTLDGDVANIMASKVVVGGKEYEFDIAYDMKNTIGIKAEIADCEEIEFA